MDFYDKYENTLARNTICLDSITSDLVPNNNYNSSYVLSTLNDFYDRNYVSVPVMDDFNNEVYQRVVYENIIDMDDPLARKSYRTYQNEVDYDIPVGYEIAKESDSIFDAVIFYTDIYIRDKYPLLDMDAFESIVQRMDHFDTFSFYLKMLNILDCFSHIEINKYYENIQNMLNEENDSKDILNVSSSKSYIGIMWNNFLAYLSKCNKDIHELFILQGWNFIEDFIQKKI